MGRNCLLLRRGLKASLLALSWIRAWRRRNIGCCQLVPRRFSEKVASRCCRNQAFFIEVILSSDSNGAKDLQSPSTPSPLGPSMDLYNYAPRLVCNCRTFRRVSLSLKADKRCSLYWWSGTCMLHEDNQTAGQTDGQALIWNREIDTQNLRKRRTETESDICRPT